MTDLTIVSCLAPCVAGTRDFGEAAERLQPLIDSGVPLAVYVEDEWMAAMQADCSTNTVRLLETSPDRRLAGISTRTELEDIWAASTYADRPSLDALAAALTKMGMLHDQSIWNPFGTKYLVWIDADVAASVHPGYFTEARLLESLNCLLRRFLILTRPSAMTDAAGTAEASRVQSQLFGGELAEIAQVNALYYGLLERLVREGVLPTEESIFSRLLEQRPESFDRFVLQENGLLGAFFEALRSGRVPIERTRMH